jgi:hypothetical protein
MQVNVCQLPACNPLCNLYTDAMRNIHAVFQAKMPEKPHGYCVILVCSMLFIRAQHMHCPQSALLHPVKSNAYATAFEKVSNGKPATRDVSARHPRKISQIL